MPKFTLSIHVSLDLDDRKEAESLLDQMLYWMDKEIDAGNVGHLVELKGEVNESIGDKE